MFKVLNTWLIVRKKQRLQRVYNNGYNYAAGSLLRGETTPLKIQAKCENSQFNTAEDHIFDLGAMDAVDKLCQIKAVLDDRVRG